MDTSHLEVGYMAQFSPYWLSWSNGYDICLPNFKMLAEDPSSILGGSTGTWKISGTTFSFIFFHETTTRPFAFKIRDPLVSSVRALPRRWQGRKRTVTVAILDA
jgi:hypothetical protein